MERRNFVFGLGGIAASAGLVAGSGAFTQIESDRDMTVQIADDADAYLSLAEGTSAGEYATVNADGHVEISFGAVNDALGANDDAVTWFDDLVEVGNNGNSDVTLGYEIADSGGTDVTSDINLYTGSGDAGGDLGGETLTAYDDTADPAVDTLEFGVEMDSRSADVVDGETYTVTITANQA